MRHRFLAIVRLSAALTSIAACGDSDSPSFEMELSPSESEAAAEQLAGRYAHYDVVAYESDTMKTLIISYGFTDLYVEDGVLMAHESFCSSEHRTDQPIKTSMSDAATQAIKPRSIAVELMRSDDGDLAFFRPETPTPIGIKLDDPVNQSLPTDPDDPRISDDDGDGKPGVTVKVDVSDSLSGEIYIARREIFAYTVEQEDDGSLVGTVSDRSEQLVIGASDPIFDMPTYWTQVEDLSKSPIILKPVTKDWDCARLKQERPKLFPPTPEVDW